MKFPTSPQYQDRIRTTATPGSAKKLGRSRAFPLRKDWEEVKEAVMMEGLRAKFIQNNEFRKELLATGSRPLVERTRGDYYWYNNML